MSTEKVQPIKNVLGKSLTAKKRTKTMFSYMSKDVLYSDKDNSDKDKPTCEVVSCYTHAKSSWNSSPSSRSFTPDGFSSSEDDTLSQKAKLVVSAWLASYIAIATLYSYKLHCTI